MKYLKLIYGLLSLAAPLAAQQSSIPHTVEGDESLSYDPTYDQYYDYDQGTRSDDRWVLRAEGGYTFGKYAGFDKDYGEAGVFFAPAAFGRWQPFADVRAYLISREKFAFGTGLGLRTWNDSMSRALGANIFYDYQNAHFEPFHRVGFGLETLGSKWDMRLNGYLIVNGDTKSGRLHTFTFPGGFIETCRIKETAFSGVDAEIGISLCRRDALSLYAAGGPYYYRGCNTEAFGGYLRLQMKWMDIIRLEARVGEDNQFHTQYQGSVLLSFPLDALVGRDLSCQMDQHQILTQPVERNPLITTQQCCDRHGNW